MIDINETDSNSVIIIKLIIVVLTVVTISFSTIKYGIEILKYRSNKKPRMGFTKGT